MSKFGIIDFEDCHVNACITDLASALCYFMIASKADDFLAVAGKILSGYESVKKLDQNEWKVLYHCICGRYIQELVLCEAEQTRQKTNEYIKASLADGWPQIQTIVGLGESFITENLKTLSNGENNKTLS